jgi:enterochelin esterase-like enzyme
MQRLFSTLLFAAVIALVAIATTVPGLADASLMQAAQKTYPKAEWVDPNRNEPNGTKYRTFSSKVLGGEVSYLVYLPPEYEQQTQRYPVIYWLHGLGGNQRGGAQMFVPHVDRAIRQSALPPAIVVVVNGMVTSFYCDWANGQRPIESVIIKDLIPHIDQTYRTVAQRTGRVIQGYSMGGFGAAHLGFKYPELFGTVVVDAGALIGEPALKGPNLAEIFKEAFANDKDRFLAEHPNQLVAKNVDKIRNQVQIRIGVGADDNLLPRNRELHELLERLSIEHEYEVVPDVAHNSAVYYKKLDAKGFALHRKVFESLAKQPGGSAPQKPAGADKDASRGKPLFDGKSLAGWKSTDFGGQGEVAVEKGAVVMEQGNDMTGITYSRGDFPTMDYEVTLEGKRLQGNDFFCTTTFPVGDSHCSLVIGGWGGTVVGISSIEFQDASENETTTLKTFQRDRWYRMRIRVTRSQIEAWIDDEKVVELATAGKKISVRIECEPCKPFGIATWRTTGAVRDIRVRTLTASEKGAAGGK